MADYAITASYLPHGLTESAVVYEVATAHSATPTDTLTITLASGVDKSVVPVAAVCVHPATPNTYQALTLTSFNSSTGVLVVTVPASGSVSTSDKIAITMLGNVL